MKLFVCFAVLLAFMAKAGPASAQTVAPARPQAPMGVYLGGGCVGTARIAEYEQWLGRSLERSSDGLAYESWMAMTKAAERGSACWAKTGLPMSIAVPLLPKDNQANLASGAKGDYDLYFVQIAETFVKRGLGNVTIRLGWEFNHSWFPWRASKDPQAWVAYWRRVVTAMRSVPGANFKFDWCPGWGKGQVDPPSVYPGDDYVDVIGIDIYNISWHPRTPEQRWDLKLNAPFGLKWQKEFAQAHGKPVSFPEWGTGTRPDGRGGGDDPYFITQMAGWIASSNVAYHNYWNYPAPDFNGILSDGSKPEAAAAFLTHFGGRK